jgi:general secretion pathway protein K
MDIPSDDGGACAMSGKPDCGISACPAGNQRGVALIIVLWIFIFLFAVAFDFSANVREEANAAHRFSEDTQGYYLALAGFQRGLYEHLMRSTVMSSPGEAAQETETPPGFFDDTWREEKLGNGIFRVRLIDEGGKINLNRVDEATLRNILTNLGVDEPRRSVLVDSILDWIDSDNLHRVNGAESDYYQSLSPGYTAKDAAFDTVEELLWVRGMTPELFFGSAAADNRRPGLAEIFTVDSPIDRINLRTTTAEVITALLGIPEEKTRAFLEARKKLANNTIGDLLPLLGVGAADAAMKMFVFTNPSVITIEAEGTTTGVGAPRRVKGVVRVAGGQGGFEIVRWIDRANPPVRN